MGLFTMEWVYFDLREDGYLYDEDGHKMTRLGTFPDAQAAEQYLEDNDVRGTVR